MEKADTRQLNKEDAIVREEITRYWIMPMHAKIGSEYGDIRFRNPNSDT